MVETIKSPSRKRLDMAQALREGGHEFEQGELVTKADAQRILKQADKPCTIQCQVDGMNFQVPLRFINHGDSCGCPFFAELMSE